MNILVSGGTGLIGSAFIYKFGHEHDFTVISRSPENAKQQLGERHRFVHDVESIEDIGAFDAILNLAGEPIADKRWTDTQKTKICDSRWNITSELVAKINRSDTPPSIFLSGSAIGFYGRQGGSDVTEKTVPHEEFTHALCAKWEAIATSVNRSKTRVCTLRTGVVLAESGGALDKMATPFKLCLGGKIGSGEQYLSWIHIDDIVAAIAFLLTHGNCDGPFNLTAPEPATNREFSQTLASSLSRPCLFTVPSFMLKIAMGESSDMILEGQKVLPEKLIKAGFTFSYPTLQGALSDIYGNA